MIGTLRGHWHIDTDAVFYETWVSENLESNLALLLGRDKEKGLTLWERETAAAVIWELIRRGLLQDPTKVVPAGPCDLPGASPACGGGDRGGL